MFFDPGAQFGRMPYSIVGIFGSSIESVPNLLFLFGFQVTVVTATSII